MKRTVVFLVLITIMLLSACMKEGVPPAAPAEKPEEITLKELEGIYELIDDRVYGT